MSIFSSYKKIFLLGFIVVILIAIPFSVYVAQQRQQSTTKATASTSLSFKPISSTIEVGNVLTLGIVLDPGTGSTANQVSYVKLSIQFDPKQFTTITKTDEEESFMPNLNPLNTLTTVLEDPIYESDRVSISLSIGADPTKVVTTKTEIAILKLKTLSATVTDSPSLITFGSETQVLSIAPGDKTNENVLNMLSTTIPANVIINAEASAQPSSPSATLTSIPVCSSLNVDKPTTGTAPYSLTFTAVGSDPDGTINEASFNFGDGPIQVVTTGEGIGTSSANIQISHTYDNPGIYNTYAILTDNNNNLSAQEDVCAKTITVNSETIGIGLTPIVTQVPQPLPTTAILPPTGPGEKMLGIGAIGIILAIIGGVLFMLL